jgi:hypothetical protein
MSWSGEGSVSPPSFSSTDGQILLISCGKIEKNLVSILLSDNCSNRDPQEEVFAALSLTIPPFPMRTSLGFDYGMKPEISQ